MSSPIEDRPKPNWIQAAAWAGFLALAVAAPWLRFGYLFGTDWPGPRRFDLPSEISSSAPLQITLVGISRLVGAEASGKILVLAILAGGGLAAFQALPTTGFAGRLAAATLFIANPFVFGRLHYGQVYLLAGYALLPWVASRARALCAAPSWRGALTLGLSVALVGVFTEHLFLVAGVVTGIVVLAHVATNRHARSLAAPVVLAAAATLVLSSYWIVPLLFGKGYEAGIIAGTGSGQLQAYAAVGDPNLGLVPNLLGLYGFWAENAGRFTSMKAFVPMWPVVLAAILAVSAVGFISAGRGRERGLRAWVIGLVIAGAFALVLEMGVSHPLTAGLVQWLDSTFPIYKGMRDAGKWAALLGLVYSQLFGLGVNEILERIRKLDWPAQRLEWVGATAIGLLIAVPLYYGNGLLFGMHGEIRPSAYPSGWYAADRILASDSHPGRTLFLPWHQYMAYSFIQNQNKVVASPAPTFFSVPILSSSNPEVFGVSPPSSPDQVAISTLVSLGSSGQWASVLAERGVKYVLLAKDVDWQAYQFLGSEPGITLVVDYGSIDLFRNDQLH